ncbi:hypothetical protein Plec18167_006937 [Paecilomyces lecythidis]|uniref:DNA repair protein Rad26 n=1 Tax=Paecilomyces lecythidis TaxID=3004212 RepID=A0ABR3X778_9EURO
MDDSDDDFFDDGFESIPTSTLLQLEQNAYQATQAQKTQQTQDEPVRSLQDQSTYALQSHVSTLRQPAFGGSSLRPPSLPTGLSNEYGEINAGEEFEAEVFDNAQDHMAELQREHAYMQGLQNGQDIHMGGLQHHDGHFGQNDTDGMEVEEYLHDDTEVNDTFYEQHGRSVQMEEVMARIDELTRKNQEMMQELETAKSNALTKSGEISIIRANQAKLAERYDQQLSSLRKSLADEAAKHKAELEAARAQSKTLATENAFLKQDLAEEALKSNNLRAKSRAKEKSQPVTPKKTRVLPFRDGFDDDEIAVFSPTKSSGGRTKRGSPAVPGKRKRKPSQDGPIPIGPLELSPSRHFPPPEPEPEVEPETSDDGSKDQRTFQKDDENLRYMKLILNHRTPPNTERDIEAMARIAFPSQPDRMFSTIVIEATSSFHTGNYAVQFARCIISLWSQALKEKFYRPIYILMGIIKFILLLDTSHVAPNIIEELLPVIQESVAINGVPRFHHSPASRKNWGQVRQTPQSQLNKDVDSTEALSILYLTATGCLGDENAKEAFWRRIRYDFILMMLHTSQPISDIALTLNLLTCSLRRDSIGPLLDTEQDQFSNENYIVDRVANLFYEKPQVDEGQTPYTGHEVCRMRLEALSFLNAVAFSAPGTAHNHGSSVIATHPTALARLIRSMHDEVDALYDYRPEHDMHNSLVNGLMGLIYGVTRKHKEIDLQSKLHLVAGGKQKYLIVLTRLAFSESPFLEAGITDETVEMAHEMLEEAVNPQEAEALAEAFPSASRREDS